MASHDHRADGHFFFSEPKTDTDLGSDWYGGDGLDVATAQAQVRSRSRIRLSSFGRWSSVGTETFVRGYALRSACF